mgnify:CR=1 FL=1
MRAEKRAWAEISLDAIENNIKEIRRYVRPSAQILGVVKADAYGHGYLEVAKTLLENGADALAVAFILPAQWLVVVLALALVCSGITLCRNCC